MLKLSRPFLFAATAILSSALTALVMWSADMAKIPGTVKLENDHVKITEVVYQPGVARERYTRPTNQVIVFLDESRYERQDSATKEKTVRTRKAGDVIWHDKGEDAPVLTNLGSKPYRTLLIEMKK